MSKEVYIANVFPKVQNDLPTNLIGIWHRARDIVFSDKIKQARAVHTSTAISKCMKLIREMRDALDSTHANQRTKQILAQIEKEYQKLKSYHGLIIEDMIEVERAERIHYIFEDADFSVATITELIRQGEADAEKVLNRE